MWLRSIKHVDRRSLSVPPTRPSLVAIPEILHADGPPTVFQCISERASPLPTFEWYKNDRLIQRFVLIESLVSCIESSLQINWQSNQCKFILQCLGVNSPPNTCRSSADSTVSSLQWRHGRRNEDRSTTGCSMWVSSNNNKDCLWQCLVLVKPMISLLWNDRALNGTLHVIENTSGRLDCRVSANPSLPSPIEWLNNDQLMIGKNRRSQTH